MKPIIFVLIMLAFPMSILAQDDKKNEVVLQAIFVRQNPDFNKPNFTFDQSTDQIGAAFSYARFGDGPIGLNFEVADSAASTSDTASNLATATVGVILKARKKSFAPFVKANIGIARTAIRGELLNRQTFDRSNTGLAVVAGGGFDIKVGNAFIRLPEISFLGTKFEGEMVKNIRIGAGLGFRF